VFFDLIIWYVQASEDAHLPADRDTIPLLRGTSSVTDSSGDGRNTSIVNSSGSGRSVSVADSDGGDRSGSVADNSGDGWSASVVDSSGDGWSGDGWSGDGSDWELRAGDPCARVFGDWCIR
jgi:hypothetical protein